MPTRPMNWDSDDPEAYWGNPHLFWDLGLVTEDTMAEPIQIKLDLRALSEQDYITRLTTIHTNMAKPENATLVTGSPFTAAELKEFVDEFAAKAQAQKDNVQAGKTITTQKRDAKDAADTAATKLARFFEAKKDITPAQVQGLGFTLKSDATPPSIVAPDGLDVKFGDVPGQVSVHWNPVPGAVTYMVHYRLANTPDAPWQLGYNNSTSDCRVNGLTPGALYEFKVCVVFAGRDQPGPACSVVEHRAA